MGEVDYAVPDEYFQLLGPSKKDGNFRFKCLLCGGDKSISAHQKSRLNLRNHITSKHKGSVANYDAWCRENDKRGKRKRKSADDSNDADVQLVSKSPKRVQPSISSALMGIPGGRKLTQSMLDKYILEYITDSILPFNHVESDAFKSFVENLIGSSSKQVRIKGRTTYTNRMKELFQSQKKSLIDSMEKADYVCLTADHWSARGRGFLGITAHWLSKEQDSSPTRENACIALRRITGRCTYDVLGKEIESVMAEYGLQSKVSHCVTDSGSNFVKAFKVFAHQEASGPSQDQGDIQSADEEQPLVAEPVNELLTEGPEEGTEMYDLPPHFRCAAHRLNLIATGPAATEALGNPRCKTVYRSLMAKLSHMWNKQSRSTVVADKIRDQLGRLLITPNATRWNSTYDALSRVHIIFKEKKADFQSLLTSESLRPITENEERFLGEFLRVFRPLALALDILQGNTEAGYLLPTLQVVKEEWMEVGQHDLEYCTGLLGALQADLNRRFEDEFESEFFQIAAAVHPVFKLSWVSDDEKKTKIRQAVKAVLPDYEGDEQEHNVSEAPTTSNQSFFQRLKDKNKKKNNFDLWAGWADSEDEKVPPFLQNVFIQYNTTMPSSAAVERMFSLAGRVLSPTRALLSDANFEMCVFLVGNCNRKDE